MTPPQRDSQKGGNAPAFRSILFECHVPAKIDELDPPEFFREIHLDQIVGSMTSKREEYNLKPLF